MLQFHGQVLRVYWKIQDPGPALKMHSSRVRDEKTIQAECDESMKY